MPTIPLNERIEGGLIGLLVGDALGVPYEFHPPHSIPPLDQIEFVPPRGFSRAHTSVPPGTWSDDGAQALALLASLLDQGKLDQEDLGRRIVAWYQHGNYAVGKIVFDVGIQTSQAIRALLSGTPANVAGPSAEQANGNGSLMRVLPLALWHRGSDTELVQDAHAQSRVTHGHLRSQICCALYCLWARRTLEAVSDPWSAAVTSLRAIYGAGSQELKELDNHIQPDTRRSGDGSGYVVDCLISARQAVEAGSYEQVVKAAIAMGNDTDTTACVAGGIAGLRDGVSAIPERWRSQLRGQEILLPLRDRLLHWHAR